ncbi:hypothetical protein [Pseudomonas sp. Marseille-P9899]|uniref:hypothetical protein n=1 Tax=Pseudomonas sp. Marseille-P9899 TaxID=2730401 RepID=UPI00158ABBB7|nr:hypothetical protein [Pseudomonas sp. Marseille-P9899]
MAFYSSSPSVTRQLQAISLAVLVGSLSGCITTQAQPDGSTKVNLSLADALGLPKTQTASQPTTVATNSAPSQVKPAGLPNVRALETTKLAGLFTKYPYDGTTSAPFPRVAVTVTDWSRSDCWVAKATIWWSAKKSEPVAPFSVCWGQSLGFAVNNAAGLHMFIGQSAMNTSGNVRTDGPKPPMMAVPSNQQLGESKMQQDFPGFISQLVVSTGWEAGGDTNMWLVGYKKQ